MEARMWPRVRRESVVAQVYQALRSAVLDRRLRPGQRVVVTDLAAQLGVSRTPVREALSKLETEGLVETLPQGGYVVRDLETEIEEVYGLRQRLEGYAARLAAERITPEELAALEEACERAAAAVDSEDLEERARLNNEFHRLLTMASHSPTLIRLVDTYRDYFLTKEALQAYDRQTALQHHQQHREIVSALRARDGERAEQLVREHFTSALAMLKLSGAPPARRGRRTGRKR